MQFGLVGSQISYSLSPFIHTFLLEYYNVEATYVCIDIPLERFDADIQSELLKYRGVNVTIPYKQHIMSHYKNACMSNEVSAIGVTNCIDIQENQITLHNTDIYGFIQPLLKYTRHRHKKTLILGSGGAMKAAHYALATTYPQMEIKVVSRNPKLDEISYDLLAEIDIENYGLIINTTPISPYQFKDLAPETILYDLNYRDEKCQFLHLHPDTIHINGIAMLVYQAVRSFEIWNKCKVESSIIENLFKEIEVQYGIKQ